MNKLIYREGFTIKPSKFDFFFGRVKSSRDNERRSKDNLQGLLQLGIDEELGGRERLLQIFRRGLNAPQVRVKTDRYGITLVRKVEITEKNVRGAVEISYLYRDNNLDSIPEITTLITKIYPQKETL